MFLGPESKADGEVSDAESVQWHQGIERCLVLFFALLWDWILLRPQIHGLQRERKHSQGILKFLNAEMMEMKAQDGQLTPGFALGWVFLFFHGFANVCFAKCRLCNVSPAC